MTGKVTAPVARQEAIETTLHGITLTDAYAWLRNKGAEEVTAYLEAENAYTASQMAGTEPLQAALYREMLSHIKETDESAPYRYGDWWYSTRTVEGLQYPIHCRRERCGEAYDPALPEQVMLDVNILAEAQAFMALGALAVSPNGALLAYSTDNTGFRQYTLRVRDLRTGQDLPDSAERVGSIAWAADNATVFYTTEDKTTKRQDKLFRHRLGASAERDVLVYEEQDERFNLGVGRSRDGRFLMLEAGSHTTSECRFLPSETPEAAFTLIAPRIDDQEYTADHRDGSFYIRVNDTGKNFRVVTAPVRSPGRERWAELIAEDPAAPLEDFDLFAGFSVCSRRRAGLTTLEIRAFKKDGGVEPAAEIAFPEPAYTAAGQYNREFQTGLFRYSYQSLVSPPSVYDYDVLTGRSTLVKQQEVPGGFDAARYGSERLWFRAEDGTEVPVSLVYRRESFKKRWNESAVRLRLRVIWVSLAHWL